MELLPTMVECHLPYIAGRVRRALGIGGMNGGVGIVDDVAVTMAVTMAGGGVKGFSYAWSLNGGGSAWLFAAQDATCTW